MADAATPPESGSVAVGGDDGASWPEVATGRAPIRSRVASSVRFRLTVSVVLVVGISLFGGGTLLVKWVESGLVNDLVVRNERILDSMVQTTEEQRAWPSEFFAPLGERPIGDETVAMFGGEGAAEEAISTTYFYLDGAVGDIFPGVNRRSGEISLFQRQGPPADTDQTVEVTRDIQTTAGVVTLHAVSSVADIERSVGAISAALWLGLPVLVIGAGIMTWLITGRTLAPVGVMTRRVRELSATTLDARVPVPPTDDEIAELASTMNEMLDRLQAASVSQRQFVSDASHELRSPVASIRAQLETALQYPDDVDWPSVARIVLAEDARLEHLVGNLLAMARLEEGRLGPRSEIDLEDLVLDQTRRMTGVQLDLSSVSAGRVWGNPDELTSVVRNLLDNAARYADSTVAVSVREAGPWVVLCIDDDGPGVPVEDRERVFERFARLQEGRSRDQGGTGLGLALSRRVAEAHGGRVHVEASPMGGASFVVALPAAGWTGTVQDDDAVVDDAAGAEPASELPVGDSRSSTPG